MPVPDHDTVEHDDTVDHDTVDTVRLFSYGTLQQPEVQQATFGRRLSGQPDTLPGYRLRSVAITDPHVIAVSGSSRHPMLVPSTDPTDPVEGTVFTLSSGELAAADEYEVADYARVEVLLGSELRAWVYLDQVSTTRDDRQHHR